jgi:hypothetical protein
VRILEQRSVQTLEVASEDLAGLTQVQVLVRPPQVRLGQIQELVLVGLGTRVQHLEGHLGLQVRSCDGVCVCVCRCGSEEVLTGT